MLRKILPLLFIGALAACKKTSDQDPSTQQDASVWSNYHLVDSAHEYYQWRTPPYDTIITHYTINATGRMGAQLTDTPRYLIFRADSFFEVQSGRTGYGFGAWTVHTPGMYTWINLGEDTVRIESVLNMGQYYRESYLLTGIRTR